MPTTYNLQPTLKSFSSIPPTPLSWLWHLRIPKGKLTLLAGDPASGKTSLLLDLASRLSRGEPMPPTPQSPPSPTVRANASSSLAPRSIENPDPESRTPDPEPLATLLLSPEDNRADTLRPKLDKLHANLAHIHTLDNFHSLIPDPSPIENVGGRKSEIENPPTPIETLTAACAAIPNLALLILDPITYYLGLTDRIQPKKSKADGLNPSVPHRTLLAQLAHLAESQNIAILLTTRLLKKIPDRDPSLASLRRALGSLAFTATARSVLLTLPIPSQSPPSATRANPLESPPDALPTIHTESSTTHSEFTHSPILNSAPTHLLLSIKSNLSQTPPPLAFTLADQIIWHPAPFQIPESTPPQKRPADSLLHENSFVADAADFLHHFLQNGPQRATLIQKSALQLGISPSSLRRARIALKLPTKLSQKRRAWFVSLPNDPRPIPSEMEEVQNDMRIYTEHENFAPNFPLEDLL